MTPSVWVMPGFRGLTALASSSTSDTPRASPGSEALLGSIDPQARRVQSDNTQDQATAGTLVFMPEVGGGALESLLMGFRVFPYPPQFYPLFCCCMWRPEQGGGHVGREQCSGLFS